jgi:hypothetical protein
MAQVVFCALFALLFWVDADLLDGWLRWVNFGAFILFTVQGCRAAYYGARAAYYDAEDDA